MPRTVKATLDVHRAALEELGEQPFPEGSGDLSGAPATRWRLTRDILGGSAGSDLWCVPKAMMGPDHADTPFVVVSPDGSTVESEPSPEEVAPYLGENLVLGTLPVGAPSPDVETVSTPERSEEREALQRIAALSEFDHVTEATRIAREALTTEA